MQHCAAVQRTCHAKSEIEKATQAVRNHSPHKLRKRSHCGTQCSIVLQCNACVPRSFFLSTRYHCSWLHPANPPQNKTEQKHITYTILPNPLLSWHHSAPESLHPVLTLHRSDSNCVRSTVLQHILFPFTVHLLVFAIMTSPHLRWSGIFPYTIFVSTPFKILAPVLTWDGVESTHKPSLFQYLLKY